MSEQSHAPIVGQLIQAGLIQDADGEAVHGVIIECERDVLRHAKIPLYSDVIVLHSRSTPGEILDFLNHGIPWKTIREVYAGIHSMLEQLDAKP